MRFALVTAICLLFAASTVSAGDGPIQNSGLMGAAQKGALQKGYDAAQKGMKPLQKPSQKATQKGMGAVQKPLQKPYQK